MVRVEENDSGPAMMNSPGEPSVSFYEDAKNTSQQNETMISETKAIKKQKTKRKNLRRTRRTKQYIADKAYSKTNDSQFILIGLFLAIATFIHQQETQVINEIPESNRNHLHQNLKEIDALYTKFPDLLSPKEVRIIKTRLAAHLREVSILMLLGRSRDYNCNLDPTYCIGQTIAKVTTKQYGYIDASDPSIHSEKIERELADSLGGSRDTVMIDSLERLHGSKVMNLFQFIDRDAAERRRGMLILTVYVGSMEPETNLTRLKGPEIVEKVLTNSWSALVPQDSLNSVISRIVPSLVKLV